MSKIVEGLLYSEDHEWIKVEGNEAYIGVTDHAQHQLGEIVYVELPAVDDELNAGDVFGVIESVKAASDSYLPVSGKIVAVNEDLEDNPGLVNEDPYANWVVKVELSDSSELDKLMDAKQYEEFCNE
ncbi:glycine cleavage system H protein GcvH [Gottschalkia purinilytica]|uniref:Glycine cleavage system H protein n=1 Tax=Gottschalkia purinilytica TaxID=1503 RepID=A0A0L0W7L4_GOTPU|nr:glycine cleavage system protein GcvH [Gottschalkia purinilytica]KNF07543.1 glycine cleavage system H protein GcvH [Gottschalkia purinilytica]